MPGVEACKICEFPANYTTKQLDAAKGEKFENSERSESKLTSPGDVLATVITIIICIVIYFILPEWAQLYFLMDIRLSLFVILFPIVFVFLGIHKISSIFFGKKKHDV